jgi:hypothetical protein
MAIVTEYDMESETWTHTPPPPARQAFRAAVAEVAAKASVKLPDCVGRIDSAVKIVLAGDVELLPEGGARVASRTAASVQYHVVNGVCDCRDYARAPGNLCAHRLAYGIARRVAELVPPSVTVETEPLLLPPAPALPEAPASCNVYLTMGGHKVQVTLRDTDEQRMLDRLQILLDRYPAPASPPASPQGHGQDTGWCQQHGVPLKLNHGKDCRTWLSHKTADGWCKGKGGGQ